MTPRSTKSTVRSATSARGDDRRRGVEDAAELVRAPGSWPGRLATACGSRTVTVKEPSASVVDRLRGLQAGRVRDDEARVAGGALGVGHVQREPAQRRCRRRAARVPVWVSGGAGGPGRRSGRVAPGERSSLADLHATARSARRCSSGARRRACRRISLPDLERPVGAASRRAAAGDLRARTSRRRTGASRRGAEVRDGPRPWFGTAGHGVDRRCPPGPSALHGDAPAVPASSRSNAAPSARRRRRGSLPGA